MWGVWSDVLEVWLSAGNGMFTAELKSVAEAQAHCMRRQREMSIQQMEAKAEEMRRQQSGIMTPSAMRVPGVGNVPLRGNGKPGVPQGNVQVVIPPDAEWRVRSIDEWWKATRMKKAKTVDLTG